MTERAGLEAMVRRVEALEGANRRMDRECRRWRWAGGSAVLGALLLIACGANMAEEAEGLEGKTVEAEHFVLRDADGLMRAALAIRPDGTPGFGLFDENGQVRLSLDLGTSGASGVNLHDEHGTLQAALTVRPDGTPGFGLFDKEGHLQLSLDSGRDGSAGINVYGGQESLRAALAVRPDGTPALGIFDDRGRIQRSIDLDAPSPNATAFQ